MSSQKILIYVGTYTSKFPHVKGKAKGIPAYHLNTETGELTFAHEIINIENPSYLAIHPNKQVLYAANEALVKTIDGINGAVTAFSIDSETGELAILNHQPASGNAPAHLTVDQSGKYILVANYSGGNVGVYPIKKNGAVGERTCTVQHHGSSVNPQRQEAPHAHYITPDPANRYVLVADLGIDSVIIYSFDTVLGKLNPTPYPGKLADGAGPRHLVFHPTQDYVFVTNELNSTVTVFQYQPEQGSLEEIQSISTLPDDFTGENTTAAIHITPNGKFLYVSNRGHHSIAIFAVDASSGTLQAVGHESTQGENPRDFMIDSSGKLLLAGNQDTDTIVSFWIDEASGKLTPTGHIAEALTPVCLQELNLAT